MKRVKKSGQRMDFNVNNSLKRQIKKEFRKQDRFHYFTWITEKIIIISAITSIVISRLTCMIKAEIIVFDRFTRETLYENIWHRFHFFFFVTLIIGLMLAHFRIKQENEYLEINRKEKIHVENNILKYFFQRPKKVDLLRIFTFGSYGKHLLMENYDLSDYNSKNMISVCTLDLNTIKKIEHDKFNHKIIIEGMMSFKNIDKGLIEYERAQDNIAEYNDIVIINDYFSPSLFDFLQSYLLNNGINIEGVSYD